MATTSVILCGGGEHARVVLDSLLSMQMKVHGLFDPRLKGDLFGVPQLGPYDPEFFPEAQALVTIGSNRVRKKVVLETRHHFFTLIEKTALVSERATVGVGSMILHKGIVQAQVKIGEHVILNTAAQVDHDCIIGDYAHLAPGSILCGTVQVGEGTLVGAGSVILPGVRVGAWAIIGAGSVLTRDVGDFEVVAGNPARVIRKKSTND